MGYLIGIIIISASLLVFIAGIGILRFGDLYARMHAVTKVSSLGMVLLLLAVNLYFLNWGIFIKTVIIFLTVVFMAPVAAHLLAKVWRNGNDNGQGDK
ncbi:multicomponent Na+:H+ antiporter subunit G [Breznakibacter xylanolyticus]|uniref:Multicomponent Na+:H+ antiporter subunit G n=1 Tax=Breznakibacter xylanolyticus TaxID=990 RepID=A0A2W7NCB1_9BACT|nr:monovalent cation/H(+) antiporter subunit G [Breznakibacter xylanolyticus]PZX17253.1 multicomponent Na+:H+ antiporter subunit G [Breznakibacter xylanolyticus]